MFVLTQKLKQEISILFARIYYNVTKIKNNTANFDQYTVLCIDEMKPSSCQTKLYFCKLIDLFNFVRSIKA